MKKSYLVVYSLVLILVTASLTYSATLLSSDMGKLKRVETIIENNYYQDIDKNALADGAIRGMASSLDPWTSYMNTEEFTEFSTMMSGSYAGIGIAVSVDTTDNLITIINAFEGSPAEKAGLANGDKILKVDGEEVFGDKLDMAVAKMKGTPDTSVTITILKKDAKTATDIVITRANIVMKSVQAEMKQNNIGYIKIASFDEKTAIEFKEKLDTLKSQSMKSLIIDLRNNPGGIVQVTEEIADMFLNDGVIYSIKGKNVKDEVYHAKAGALDFPLVVLVNGDSASASELLAGALKDNNRAVIVGEKTYGKGVMQQLMPLGDGGAIKVTIAKYFTPNGTDIDKIGITPDHAVDGEKEQLNKAIELLK